MARRVALSDVVAPGVGVSPEDLGQLKWALSRFGIYDPANDDRAQEDAVSPGLRNAIERFQDSQRLSVDGVLKPGGPTESRLNFMLRALDEPAMNPGLHDRNGRPVAERMTAFEARRRREATLGALAGRVGPGLENHPQDVAAAAALLASQGGTPGEGTDAIAGWTGPELFDGFRRFQRSNGLKVDGVIAPGGETEARLTALRDATGKAPMGPNSGSPGGVPAASAPTIRPVAYKERRKGPRVYPPLPTYNSPIVEGAAREIQRLFEQGVEEAGELGDWLIDWFWGEDGSSLPDPVESSPADPIEPIGPPGLPSDPPYDPGVPPSEPPREQPPDRTENVPPAVPPGFDILPGPEAEIWLEPTFVERWGGEQTRADIGGFRKKFGGRLPDWELIGSHPGDDNQDRLAEPRYGPANPVPGRSPMYRGSYADLGYLSPDGKRLLLIQHQNTLADGMTPNKYEAENAARLLENARAAKEEYGIEVFILQLPKRIKYKDGTYESNTSYNERTDKLIGKQLKDFGIIPR